MSNIKKIIEVIDAKVDAQESNFNEELLDFLTHQQFIHQNRVQSETDKVEATKETVREALTQMDKAAEEISSVLDQMATALTTQGGQFATITEVIARQKEDVSDLIQKRRDRLSDFLEDYYSSWNTNISDFEPFQPVQVNLIDAYMIDPMAKKPDFGDVLPADLGDVPQAEAMAGNDPNVFDVQTEEERLDDFTASNEDGTDMNP